MKAARFDVTVELLQHAIHMPATSRIVDVQMSDDDRSITITATDPELPEAHCPHPTTPILTEHYVEWDWGVTAGDAE